MKRIVIALAAAVVIPACHGNPDYVIVDPIPPGPSPTAEVRIQVANYDYWDYEVWLKWEDGSGTSGYVFLFYVYGDPWDGPTVNYASVVADPGVTYEIQLSDAWGDLWDFYPFQVTAGTLVDLRFDVEDGYLTLRP